MIRMTTLTGLLDILQRTFYSGCRYIFIFLHLNSLPGKFWYCEFWIILSWMSSWWLVRVTLVVD